MKLKFNDTQPRELAKKECLSIVILMRRTVSVGQLNIDLDDNVFFRTAMFNRVYNK